MMLGPRDASGNVGENQVVPAVEGDQPIAGGEIRWIAASVRAIASARTFIEFLPSLWLGETVTG